MGGLARRVSLLTSLLQQDTVPTLVISGAHEFFWDLPPDVLSSNSSISTHVSAPVSPPSSVPAPGQPAVPFTGGPVEPPKSVTPEKLRTAYGLARVHAGYAGPKTRAWFGAVGLPTNFVEVNTAPVVRRIQINALRVAVILFPPARETLSDKALTSLLDTAHAAKDADIVIGVSPWGFRLEGKTLSRLAEGFDVLLGSGEGAPFPLEVTTYAPGIIWSRADRDARSITELRLYTLPGPNAARPRAWLNAVDVQGQEHPLGMNILEDTAVTAVIPAPL